MKGELRGEGSHDGASPQLPQYVCSLAATACTGSSSSEGRAAVRTLIMAFTCSWRLLILVDTLYLGHARQGAAQM